MPTEVRGSDRVVPVTLQIVASAIITIRETYFDIICAMLLSLSVEVEIPAECSQETRQFIMMPNNMIFLAIEILMAKLYVNSFLAMMNARGALRDTSHKQSPSVSRSTQRTVAVHVEEDRRVIHDFEMSPQSPFDKDVMDITKSDTIAVAL
ncbi:hypothetical protein PUNSTDRAFT_44649 [Punctularia strigosozonata HHB-11173 SS5]|uniref:uncharacterized protein n=1 Tax=Punctularia strigosozonata (strain HHB-11173) TaxID=741275 RepID=UPI0004417459|nr:uncharacterized protein PUNSTDRAFT_44649 [Punctularia strigosozonata HHB-11173 SS5]EIN09259.1 hypothetical protein PUNSTDRAFT_44649 [Punctularia strigosozonata HHB-11173 SS5]